MNGTVTISIWWFILLLIVFSLAVLDRILIPSTRWLLRRRINRVLDDIGTRLSIEIRPFQLTKRQVLIDRLAYDPAVLSAIQEHAQANDMPLEIVQKRVLTYAREIVPSFNAYFYFRIGYWVAKKVARLLYRVRIGLFDETRFAKVDPDAAVVFVMNHRSNMDYILVAYLAAERTTLSYAVGEWAKIWPLQTLIRSMGAFFVRRRSGDSLYRRVLERYIHMATREGVCQAVFIEGGLTRDGKLRPPKLGLMDYMLRRHKSSDDRDIVFIPVGINYDRTLEDRTLLRELDPEAQKRSFLYVMRTTVGFIARSVFLMLLSRWRRYGYACVNFGAPLSVKQYCRDNGFDFDRLERSERFKQVQKLCERLIDDIAAVIPILPVALVATVLLEATDNPLDVSTIEQRASRLQIKMQSKGAPIIEMSHTKQAGIINDAVDFMLLRRLISNTDGSFSITPGQEPVLRYYANAIGHWQQDKKN
jgi:glycerol-3-phosphate O-acyltransferase